MPRTYVVGDARVADGEAGLQMLLDPAFDPARMIVLPAAPATRTDSSSSSGTSHVVAQDADRVALEAELRGDGYVVLVDAWDPAWRAWVDGRAVELLRANVAFRAVAVPAGRHTVEMRYRPATLTAGLAISLLAAGAGIAVVAGRRRPLTS